MVILGFTAEALPPNPECDSSQKQKPIKKKPFNHKSSNSTPMTLKPQYYDHEPKPRKQNKIQKHCNRQEKEKPRTTVVYIRVYDPYATESSSDEGDEEEAGTKEKKGRQILHEVELVRSMNNDHASASVINHEKQEKDLSSGWKSLPEPACKTPLPTEKGDKTFQENGRRIRRKKNKVKIHGKKNNGGSSYFSFSVKAADSGVKMELVLDCCTTCPSLGLCDVPGPIPDNLDSLMRDDNLALNFFEGLSDL